MSHITMPAVIAHRGASGHAPENTLAAIRKAHDFGATWIEIDVNISKDGVPVLFHDDGVERCSSGSGLVIEHSLTDLKALDCGAWYADEFSNERIATLDECLRLAAQMGMGINLEIKPCSGWEAPTTRAIAETLLRARALPEIIISSFSHVAMLEAHRLLKHIPRSTLYLVAPPYWRDDAARLEASNIHLHANTLLTAKDIDSFHSAGLGVYCYTVNDAAKAKQLYAIGVDGVFTNYPDKFPP